MGLVFFSNTFGVLGFSGVSVGEPVGISDVSSLEISVGAPVGISVGVADILNFVMVKNFVSNWSLDNA